MLNQALGKVFQAGIWAFSVGVLERTETGRKTQMTKFVDVWIFDWDKYSPDDLVQKCDSFQPGPALLAALVKSSRTTTCGARARLRP